jgi:drug/metabolite transporter (DMT)-like permease
VAVALLAWPALGERPGWVRLGFLLVSLAGVGTIALGSSNGENTPRGVLLLFSATVAASLFNVLSRRMSRHFSPVEVTFAMMASAAAVFGALAFSGGTAGLAARTIPALPAVAYLGCLSSVLAFFLVNFNLGRLRAARSAVFSNLSTAVSVAAGVIFMGEAFGWPQAAGSALILAGIWGANTSFAQAEPSQLPRSVVDTPEGQGGDS